MRFSDIYRKISILFYYLYFWTAQISADRLYPAKHKGNPNPGFPQFRFTPFFRSASERFALLQSGVVFF